MSKPLSTFWSHLPETHYWGEPQETTSSKHEGLKKSPEKQNQEQEPWRNHKPKTVEKPTGVKIIAAKETKF